MKATIKEVNEAMHFLNAIKILIDLKDMQYVYGNNIDFLFRCLEEIEIDNNENKEL